MKLLIGNTGLIGKTLKDEIIFDYEFNSKNIHELLNLNINPLVTDLYLCCLPATKWIVNNDPQHDLNNILNILDIITKKEYNNIILYSTIDVYNGAPELSNETYIPNVSELNYGSNRLIFENLVKTTVRYNKLKIIRLPALFGKYLKKNILFDLINNNEIHKINYNSKFQWYNLENIITDTNSILAIPDKITISNLFTEPLETSAILDIFNISKSDVDYITEPKIYNYTTIFNNTGYIKDKHTVLQEISKFFYFQKLSKLKLAVCLFGEERDLLNRINDWKVFSSKIKVDFHIALYSHNSIYETIKILKEELPVKSFFITNNDLEYFDQKKYSVTQPIYLYGADPKAILSRLLSQVYIRQKAVSIVNLDNYDAILLCRTDLSNFNISASDIFNVTHKNKLMFVNSGTHTHPGGGSGCTECTLDKKCNIEYHANDICDLWCIGSINVMKKWNTFYDTFLTNYTTIQKTGPDINDIKQLTPKKINDNEILINMSIDNIPLIENNVHCIYPEKVIRVTFKDNIILGATNSKELWEK